MQVPYAFYVVFNPLLNGENETYKTQAHEFFQRLKENLLSGQPEKDHFYWGKLKVSQHENPLEYKNFKDAVEFNKQNGLPTHLYISDFHHFWVCKVESVHQDIQDKSNTLPFYDGKEVEIWFKVSDMDLISSDYVETGYYLEQLYVNNQLDSHQIDSINPYLGGLRYPLIVQNKLNEFYFTDYHNQGKARALSNNPLIQNPQASGKLASTVQTYVLPPAIYGKLSEKLKKRLIKIEMDISKKDNDDEQLYFRVFKEYTLILQSLLNDTLLKHLREDSPQQVGVQLDGDEAFFTRDLSAQNLSDGYWYFSLSEMCKIIDNPVFIQSANLDNIFSEKLKFWKYCRSELMELVKNHKLLELDHLNHNPTQKDAMLFRNIILGVGCKGVINSLICLYYEDEFMDSYFRNVA
jgi:hypothetical protein